MSSNICSPPASTYGPAGSRVSASPPTAIKILGLAAFTLVGACGDGPDATIESAVERYTSFEPGSLWPGFDPAAVPLAIHDGERTYLYGHPLPPAGFREIDARRGIRVADSALTDLRANTAFDLGGVKTAGVLARPEQRDADALAALAVHEAFHAWQDVRHPEWTANEAELFSYPVESDDLLARRRLETGALRRAVLARESAQVVCWSQTFLRIREQRFRRMPDGAADYERQIELREGLARYVQARAAGAGPPEIPDAGYPAEDVRERGYETGHAMAELLDRLDPGWKAPFDADSAVTLERRLGVAVDGRPRGRCSPSPDEVGRTRSLAARDAAELRSRMARQRQQLQAAPGWRVRIELDRSPMFPAGFDPLNVDRLAADEIGHSRWLRLTGPAGEIEVLDRPSLTRGVGPHPLFNGVATLLVPGFERRPDTRAAGDTLWIAAEGLSARLVGATLEERGDTLRVRIAP